MASYQCLPFDLIMDPNAELVKHIESIIAQLEAT
jgi:antitoxin component of RelBE/YafQ-DinJ toxin-antitoxin module